MERQFMAGDFKGNLYSFANLSFEWQKNDVENYWKLDLQGQRPGFLRDFAIEMTLTIILWFSEVKIGLF